MKTEYQQFALKTPYAVTYGAGSLCRGEVLGVFFGLGPGKGDVMNFAFYQPEEGKEPSMLDYMQEMEIFVKEPLAVTHEVLLDLWEQGILGDDKMVDSALGTLWTCVLHLEFLEEFFHKELLKAKGIERDCIPRSSQERRLANNITIRAGLLPDHLRENVKIRLFSLDELRFVKKLADHWGESQRAKEDCEEVMEANEGAMAA